MDQSNRRIEIEGNSLSDVRKILRVDGFLDDAEVARRSWRVCEIDDKSIFGEDARRLASAFRVQNADTFYVARIRDLLTSTSLVVAYRFEATQDEIEAFQGPLWFEINLDNCVLFTLPFTCAVLRPGDVDTTKFVGNAAFIAKIGQA